MGARYRSERIPVAEILTTGVKIASALETAIRTGLLHRDIKPSNILITSFGAPVLADFGIATSIAGSGTADVIAMSVPWSAPEVVEERTPGTVASEVWALGASLYTLLAGRSPFEAAGKGENTREKVIARISKAKYQPSGRADAPARLEHILARAMDRDPARRHATLLELALDLQRAQVELGIMPTPLEVPADDWSAGTVPVDFDDTKVRGPVISTVEQASGRAKTQKPIVRTPTIDDEIFTRPARRSGSRMGIIIGVAAAVVVVLAVAAIVAASLIGGA
jgi:serine/threonine protein kinase